MRRQYPGAYAEAYVQELRLRGLVGDAPPFRAMKQHIRRIASAAAPVLIEGETGCGKELAARAVELRRRRPREVGHNEPPSDCIRRCRPPSGLRPCQVHVECSA
jgi:transcriptional regulator with AAA-type ATPase domain